MKSKSWSIACRRFHLELVPDNVAFPAKHSILHSGLSKVQGKFPTKMFELAHDSPSPVQALFFLRYECVDCFGDPLSGLL